MGSGRDHCRYALSYGFRLDLDSTGLLAGSFPNFILDQLLAKRNGNDLFYKVLHERCLAVVYTVDTLLKTSLVKGEIPLLEGHYKKGLCDRFTSFWGVNLKCYPKLPVVFAREKKGLMSWVWTLDHKRIALMY